MLDLTGNDVEIDSATWSQIQNFTYLQTIDNRTYPTVEYISYFETFVNSICNYNNNAKIDIDLKGSITTAFMTEISRILEASNCSCTSKTQFFVSTPYFYSLSTIREAFASKRCVPLINIWFHPDTYPYLNEHFFLKTKISAYYGKPDIVTAHKSIWAAFPEILGSYNANGWCTGIYGDTLGNLTSLPVTYSTVFDADYVTTDYVTYDGS